MAKNTKSKKYIERKKVINTKKYIENFLKIQTKKDGIKPLILNTPQQRLYEVLKQQYQAGKPQRVIILKARQMGFSTITGGINFKKIATSKNKKAMIVAHKDDATRNLFSMYKLFYELLPEPLKPQRKSYNGNAIEFDTPDGAGLRSKIECATAGGKGIGRSATIHNLHISEYAFWPGEKKDTFIGLMQAVPRSKDTVVIIESTANGFDHFKELWDKAVSDLAEGKTNFYPLFFAWYELDEYKSEVPADFEPQAQGDYGDEIAEQQLYNLTNEQLQWRRETIDVYCVGDLDKFKQEYPSNPEEAFIASGSSVFNNEIVIKQLQIARQIKPLKQGYFEYEKEFIQEQNIVRERIIDDSITFVEDRRGYIKIYKEPVVTEKVTETGDKKTYIRHYVLGGDTAGSGEDFFAGKVIDNQTKETAAVAHVQNIDEDIFGEQMYCLGRYYNDALIGIEVNFSYEPTRRLEQLGYTNMYVREKVDRFTNVLEKSFGVYTDTKTKPIMIATLKKAIREEPSIECHPETLSEMLTYVKDEKGRTNAQEGYHDDLVMATAITHFIAPQQALLDKVVVEEAPDIVQKNFHLNNNKGDVIEW